MPDSFKMGLMLEGKEGEKWEFTVPVKKITNTIYVPVNYQQQAEGIQLDVSKISLSPSGIALDYKATEKGTIDNPQVGASFIEFRITDQNGKEITSHLGGEKVISIMMYGILAALNPLTRFHTMFNN